METKNKFKCPHCAHGMLTHRARRPMWMKTLLFFLPIKRYECGSCFKRSYVVAGGSSKSIQGA